VLYENDLGIEHSLSGIANQCVKIGAGNGSLFDVTNVPKIGTGF